MRYEAAARVDHAPQAPRSDVVERLSPYRVADPYRWLEDAGELTSFEECSRSRGEFGSRDNPTELGWLLGYLADILAFFSRYLTGSHQDHSGAANGSAKGGGLW